MGSQFHPLSKLTVQLQPLSVAPPGSLDRNIHQVRNSGGAFSEIEEFEASLHATFRQVAVSPHVSRVRRVKFLLLKLTSL